MIVSSESDSTVAPPPIADYTLLKKFAFSLSLIPGKNFGLPGFKAIIGASMMILSAKHLPRFVVPPILGSFSAVN